MSKYSSALNNVSILKFYFQNEKLIRNFTIFDAENIGKNRIEDAFVTFGESLRFTINSISGNLLIKANIKCSIPLFLQKIVIHI